MAVGLRLFVSRRVARVPTCPLELDPLAEFVAATQFGSSKSVPLVESDCGVIFDLTLQAQCVVSGKPCEMPEEAAPDALMLKGGIHEQVMNEPIWLPDRDERDDFIGDDGDQQKFPECLPAELAQVHAARPGRQRRAPRPREDLGADDMIGCRGLANRDSDFELRHSGVEILRASPACR